MIIDCSDTARMCQCRRTGHLEAYCGANAVMKRTLEALAAGQPSALQARRGRGETLTPLILSQEAEAGDELAATIISKRPSTSEWASSA